MNRYEEHLKEKLKDAEDKIEHLYYQCSISMENNVSLTVMNASLILENKQLREEIDEVIDEVISNITSNICKHCMYDYIDKHLGGKGKCDKCLNRKDFSKFTPR